MTKKKFTPLLFPASRVGISLEVGPANPWLGFWFWGSSAIISPLLKRKSKYVTSGVTSSLPDRRSVDLYSLWRIKHSKALKYLGIFLLWSWPLRIQRAAFGHVRDEGTGLCCLRPTPMPWPWTLWARGLQQGHTLLRSMGRHCTVLRRDSGAVPICWGGIDYWGWGQCKWNKPRRLLAGGLVFERFL